MPQLCTSGPKCILRCWQSKSYKICLALSPPNKPAANICSDHFAKPLPCNADNVDMFWLKTMQTNSVKLEKGLHRKAIVHCKTWPIRPEFMTKNAMGLCYDFFPVLFVLFYGVSWDVRYRAWASVIRMNGAKSWAQRIRNHVRRPRCLLYLNMYTHIYIYKVIIYI